MHLDAIMMVVSTFYYSHLCRVLISQKALSLPGCLKTLLSGVLGDAFLCKVLPSIRGRRIGSEHPWALAVLRPRTLTTWLQWMMRTKVSFYKMQPS
jgi:hypothetical protein